MMTRIFSKEIGLTMLLVPLACGAVFAQQIASTESADAIVPSADVSTPGAPDVIFSNLVRDQGAKYSTEFSVSIAGKDAFVTEELHAIRFVPTEDVQAKVLSAAISYAGGTKLVALGIYSDNPVLRTVGDPLPGGQGTTTKIPAAGDCCQLATVRLAGSGVTLLKDQAYWLVAGPDDVNGPTFQGSWQLSYRAVYAGVTPPSAWRVAPGSWPAAEIRGAKLQTLSPLAPVSPHIASAKTSVANANVRIFTNLDRTSTYSYLFGAGVPVEGKEGPDFVEVWQALPFTPKADVHARTLSAAIAYESGTRLVRLGVYSDSSGAPGSPLPGGQGSTANIPDLGTCCELTRVALAGMGVALSKGTPYWLVASPDDVNAPTFKGAWQDSNLALTAYEEPENFINWTTFSGSWFAAEIRGTSP